MNTELNIVQLTDELCSELWPRDGSRRSASPVLPGCSNNSVCDSVSDSELAHGSTSQSFGAFREARLLHIM